MLYINHSCDPNIGFAGNVVLVAMRDIHAGEELTTDYAMFDDYEGSMDCTCGRPNCRRRIDGRDWQRPDLQEATADTSPGTSTESCETIAWAAQRPEPARQGLFGRGSSPGRCPAGPSAIGQAEGG